MKLKNLVLFAVFYVPFIYGQEYQVDKFTDLIFLPNAGDFSLDANIGFQRENFVSNYPDNSETDDTGEISKIEQNSKY